MKLKPFAVKLLYTALLFMGLNSCKTYPPTDLTQNSIIPKPVSVVATKGTFELSEDAVVFVPEESEELFQLGEYLAGILNPATGFDLAVKTSSQVPSDGGIFLALVDASEDLGEEGYELTIDEDWIQISALKPAGIARGIQTLRQLLPPRIEAAESQTGPWFLATGTIRDFPQYSYRGAMLDVARHFFKVEEEKRYIDYLALYKMNILHLHLSDDQGWRVEIKSWPNLTQHGASTEVGGGDGGFYTQEEYKEIVRYAQERFVTIVPEIDMPGHTNAALASYPQLNCDGKATELYTGTKVGFSTLCTKKEVVYEFIGDVVRELSEMTPGPYFHIGGDESHSTPLEDYIPFVNRVQDIVLANGKQVVGWDEIAHARLVPNAVVQYWAKDKNALKGVDQGARVIMSPASRAYLDMKYDSTTVLGLHWAGYIEVDHGYSWELATLVPGISQEQILGVEAPLWSETVTNLDEIEYLMIPRLLGYAEIGWTNASQRSWDDYKIRLGNQSERFDVLGINYYPSPLVPWASGNVELLDVAETDQ